MNENVVWGVADLEPDYVNVFKTRVAFNAKGPSCRSSCFKTPGKPVKAGVTLEGRSSVVSKNEHPNPRAAKTTGISSGAISKNHKRISSKQNPVRTKTVQKPAKGKFEHIAKGWEFLTLKEEKAYTQGGPMALTDDFKIRKAHPNSHLNQYNSEKRASASSTAVGHSGKSDTSPGNPKSAQTTAANSKERNANSVDHSGMDKKKKAKSDFTKAKQEKKKKFEPKAKARLIITDPEETEAEDENELGAEIELKHVTDLTEDGVVSVTGCFYCNMLSAQMEY
jgi:hypothetical protein